MSEARDLHLVVPGLLGPVPDPDAVRRLVGDLPGLGHLLTRAQRQPVASHGDEAAVFRAFGVDGPPWPVAAVTRAGEADGLAPGQRHWLRADPVHLRVDMTQARLFGDCALALEADEARALVETLNAHFAQDGLQFEAPAPGRWYLSSDTPAAFEAYTPMEVAGRNVQLFLPRGDDAPRWRTRLTEIQMLFHDAGVNRARERAGRLPVNSVWPWGGGAAPAVRAFDGQVVADDPLARGLAALAGMHVQPLPGDAAALALPRGTTVAVESGVREPLVHGEIEAWMEALGRLESRWFRPLLPRLRAGELRSLVIDPAGPVRYRVTRRTLRRFWRTSRPWTAHVEQGS